MVKKKYTFIDLFAGCGGLSEGFLQTGRFNALAHVEWEKPMVDTLRNRLVDKWGESINDSKRKVILFDIQKTDELINGFWSDESNQKYGLHNADEVRTEGLKGLVGNQHVDLIIGGPPCQAYSIHGRATDKDSMQNDYRNYLFESFCKVVDAFRPDLFVFENVPGILSAKPGDKFVIDRIFEAFDKNTLKIDTDLIYDKLQIDKNYYIDVYTRYHPTTKSLISLVSILENDASGIILGQIRVEHSPIDKLIFDIRYDEDTYKLEKSLVKIADYILEIYE